ncbi:hypothetical protein DdX_00168 [Ditylenchus destructor]|uniref:C2H2-type domain-containing protein n=1 Tax=Ditylenchus destructor TaxID=166010 RepID=A0AAD4NES6_9BILA|nr:hypothetical protein DdX_00168 [Ditylenchus destructor]
MDNYCRFDNCGLLFKNIYELIYHVEEEHLPDIEKKKLKEIEDFKKPKSSENGGAETEQDGNTANQNSQDRSAAPYNQLIPLSLLCKLEPFPSGHKVYPITPKKVTMNFCHYRKRAAPLLAEPSAVNTAEFVSPLLPSQQHASNAATLSSPQAQPQFTTTGVFQPPSLKRPSKRLPVAEKVIENYVKDLKPQPLPVSANVLPISISNSEERKYRCEVEGCKKAYKNSQGLRAHIRNAHNLSASSPRLSPSEEGILSRQLPSSALATSITPAGLNAPNPPNQAIVASSGPTGTAITADTGADSALKADRSDRAESPASGYMVTSNIPPIQRQTQIAQMSPQRIATQRAQYTPNKFVCQHCPKTYKTIMNLNKHIQESHPKQTSNLTVGQLMRSHSPRNVPLGSHSMTPKQLVSSPVAMNRSNATTMVLHGGPSPQSVSPAPMQSSHGSQQIIVSGGSNLQPQRSYMTGSQSGGTVTLVPASPQHQQQSSQQGYGQGAQAQYYVTQQTQQQQQRSQAHQQQPQQEHQYTQAPFVSPSSHQQSQPQQQTTIYVSQQSPVQLQQYTASHSQQSQPQQQVVYSSPATPQPEQGQSHGIALEGNRGAVGRTGQTVSGQVQHGQQTGYHQHTYRQMGQQQSGPQQQVSNQQRVFQQQSYVGSSNVPNVQYQASRQPPPYQSHQRVIGSSGGNSQPHVIQAIAVSQAPYGQQMGSPASSSYIVRSSNQSQVYTPQRSGTAPQQSFGSPTNVSSQATSMGVSISSGTPSMGQGRTSASPHPQQQQNQNLNTPAYGTSHHYRTVGVNPGGQQQIILRSVSPSSQSHGHQTQGPATVRMLAASGHTYAQSSPQGSQQQHVSQQGHYQHGHSQSMSSNQQRFVGPNRGRQRVMVNHPNTHDASGNMQYSNPTQQVIRGARNYEHTYEQGGRTYYAPQMSGGSNYRNYSNTSLSSTSSADSSTPAPTLQPQEPIRETVAGTLSHPQN